MTIDAIPYRTDHIAISLRVVTEMEMCRAISSAHDSESESAGLWTQRPYGVGDAVSVGVGEPVLVGVTVGVPVDVVDGDASGTVGVVLAVAVPVGVIEPVMIVVAVLELVDRGEDPGAGKDDAVPVALPVGDGESSGTPPPSEPSVRDSCSPMMMATTIVAAPTRNHMRKRRVRRAAAAADAASPPSSSSERRKENADARVARAASKRIGCRSLLISMRWIR